MNNKTKFAGLNKIGTYLDEDLPKINENTEITDAQLKQAAQEREALRESVERLAAVKPPEVPPATDKAPGIVRLATPEETKAGKIDTIAVTPAGLAAMPKPPPPPSATTALRGLSRFATVAEALAGRVGDAAVTPAGLQAKTKDGWSHKIADASSWWRLPNGLILQAGWAWAGGAPDQVGWNMPWKRTRWMSFPLAFPTNVIAAAVVATVGTAATTITVTESLATGMNLAATCATDASVWWIAIGA